MSSFPVWMGLPFWADSMWNPSSPHLGDPSVWTLSSLCSGSNTTFQAALPQGLHPCLSLLRLRLPTWTAPTLCGHPQLRLWHLLSPPHQRVDDSLTPLRHWFSMLGSSLQFPTLGHLPRAVWMPSLPYAVSISLHWMRILPHPVWMLSFRLTWVLTRHSGTLWPIPTSNPNTFPTSVYVMVPGLELFVKGNNIYDFT